MVSVDAHKINTPVKIKPKAKTIATITSRMFLTKNLSRILIISLEAGHEVTVGYIANYLCFYHIPNFKLPSNLSSNHGNTARQALLVIYTI
ncbi:MAG: hypothetical protein UU98_C0040G0008 [Parcubacteria group bacterium GW2011_GWD2_42_14]|nr:MAG: hypothetical protein UU98_C0040G0008 [Parcubacteria group bacterium GW2011_GWD2_42_14]